MDEVILLFGGRSAERLVSVASAQNVATILPGARLLFIAAGGEVYRVRAEELAAHRRVFERELDVYGPPGWASVEAAVAAGEFVGSTVFVALHGGEGEDGTIQALFERAGVPFTASGSAASALAFDKVAAKAAAAARGARISEAHQLDGLDEGQAREVLGRLAASGRWVLKPRADGSSHGLFHLDGPGQVTAAAEVVARAGVPYLAEAFVAGREVTVGVVEDPSGPTALPVSEVVLLDGGSFDYAGKYLGRGTREITPAELSDGERAAAQALALLTHEAVGCEGYSRTDMILDAAGPVLLEINTLPGLTAASFIPQQLTAAGRSLHDFVHAQLELARRRAAGARSRG